MIRFRFLATCCFCLFSAAHGLAQLSITPNILNFFTVTQGAPDSIDFTIANNHPTAAFTATDVNLFHTETYWLSDTAFTIGPGQSYTLRIYCNPYHNVRIPDWLVVQSATDPVALSAFVFAQGKYDDPYYDLSLNKWDEDLEVALKTQISFGYQDQGYTGARDAIFMQVDNKAWNGQGASQNTIECIYTGQQAVGYTSRVDCQNNFGFNTEHTVPQALFSQSPPMVSDMHHLFATTASSNSERGDNPYGVVNNPSWSVGGSKSNGTIFEPRDAHKGKGARATLYFALRYQDYSGFIASQQALLRQWSRAFPPDAVEQTRNDDIYTIQNNRNPFIDHPEFLERITLLVGTGTRPLVPRAFLGANSLTYAAPFPGSQTGYFVLSNHGIDTLTFGNLTFSNPEFALVATPNFNIPPDSARKVWVRLTPSGLGTTYTDSVTFTTNDPARPSMTVYLNGESVVVGRPEPMATGFMVYPQPAAGHLVVEWETPLSEQSQLELYTLQGQLVRHAEMGAGHTKFGMDLAGLAAGTYLLRVREGAAYRVKQVILE